MEPGALGGCRSLVTPAKAQSKWRSCLDLFTESYLQQIKYWIFIHRKCWVVGKYSLELALQFAFSNWFGFKIPKYACRYLPQEDCSDRPLSGASLYLLKCILVTADSLKAPSGKQPRQLPVYFHCWLLTVSKEIHVVNQSEV